MALKLSSTNPDFSFLIRKRKLPEGSSMQIREIGSKLCYGWYSTDDQYCLYYQDFNKNDEKGEFEKLKDEYALKIIYSFFGDTIKLEDKMDIIGYSHKLELNMIYIGSIKMINKIKKFLDNVEIIIEYICDKYYKISLASEISLNYLMNTVALVFLFIALMNRNLENINNDMVEKYINVINKLDTPFYVRYLFSLEMFKSKKIFNQYKNDLENTQKYKINLSFGNTHEQRVDFIRDQLDFKCPILDIGCGEGSYVTRFSKKVERYYAVDNDPEMLKIVGNKLAKYEIENVIVSDNFEDLVDEKVDIILTEVIEHMSKNEAEDLIRKILHTINFNKFIITTPNRTFNKYYLLDGFRHEDHKWEMSEMEFKNWIDSVMDDYKYEFVGIGCQVNNIPSTQGVIIYS